MGVFVSHDAEGTEVYVSTAGNVKVAALEEKANAVNAKFEASYLNYPLNGWIGTQKEEDRKIIELLREAHANGTEVDIRIEAVRKPNLDKSIPIEELRQKDANKNIIKRLVGVNGLYSSERLTSPADDPATGHGVAVPLEGSGKSSTNHGGGTGSSVSKEDVLNKLRQLATAREISESVLDAVKAQALIAGATPAEVISASTVEDKAPEEVRAGFSNEAPAFKDYNSDGRLNLGGPSVAAGIGVYNFVFEHLTKQQGTLAQNDTVNFYSALILAIADTIQTHAYGVGFRVDRTAGSHTRARSAIYNVIDAIAPVPVNGDGSIPNQETVNAWVQLVGKTARQNFLGGIGVSQQTPSVKEVLARLDAPTVIEGKVEDVPVDEDVPSLSETTPVVVTTDASVEEPVVHEPETPAPVVEVATESPVSGSEGVEMYPQDLLPSGVMNSSNAPSEELLEEFRAFVVEEAGLKTKEEQAKVAKLLAHTFGKNYNKASRIPEDKLGDFLDFYVANGKDNFRAVIDSL